MADTAERASTIQGAVQVLHDEMRTHTWWHAADFASQAAQAFTAARPDPAEGERARGVREGLEMAARMVLTLADIPADGGNHDG